MAVEVFVAFFSFSSGQSYLIELDGDKRTFTIIAPVHDAIRVTERRRERLGCRGFDETTFSSAALSSVVWAMDWWGGRV